MLLSTSSRQQPVLRAVCCLAKQPLLFSVRSQRRRLHRVPQLADHDDLFREKGVQGLLTPAGFDMAWTQYQAFIVSKLNSMTAGTVEENSNTKTLLLKYARQADHAALFNYASMAHNNHFFFSGLTPTHTAPSSSLLRQIDASFSSLDSLRATFIATANAMFGPGFVWLVRLSSSSLNAPSPVASLALLSTYLAGSPYPGAHFRQQAVDMATANTNVFAGESPQGYALNSDAHNPLAALTGITPSLRNTAGSMGALARGLSHKTAPGGQDLEVLLCVNTWEHIWLRDYGVAGKKKYLENWWEAIDWEKVEQYMLEAQGKSVKGGLGRRGFYA